jgi:hypothetical protein
MYCYCLVVVSHKVSHTHQPCPIYCAFPIWLIHQSFLAVTNRHLVAKQEKLGEKWLNFAYEVYFFIPVGIFKMRHGINGFTSPPKDVVLLTFITLKIHRPRLGLNPWILGPMASIITTRPLRVIFNSCNSMVQLSFKWLQSSLSDTKFSQW